MGRLVLTLLCLCAGVLAVTALGTDDLNRATKTFYNKIFKLLGGKKQFAYLVKFTNAECTKGLELNKVMSEIDPMEVLNMLNTKGVYEGKRMVAAIPTGNIGPKTRHSEFRLLDPVTDSPISRLLESTSAQDCVIFFSQNSPCVDFCTNPKENNNIIKGIHETPALVNIKDRAFVFHFMYYFDVGRDQAIATAWKLLDKEISLVRCYENNCYKCFNGDKLNIDCTKSK
ncbi:uncharacterized protein [Engystomops pustulosus]|uniref:uncharacterized protein n=1 Tax=Engystomops pustulosus TaxID=76066 RepID=UPI003AFA24F9